MPGSCKSKTRHAGASGFSDSKNSAAELKTATRRPTEEMRLDSASRTRKSSSTTKTMGLSDFMKLPEELQPEG